MSVVVDSDSSDEYNPGDEDSDQDEILKDDFADDLDLDMMAERDLSDDANPRVMLISLKAVSCRLYLLLYPWTHDWLGCSRSKSDR